jgi:hypothetical protein
VFVGVRGMRHRQEGHTDQPENTKFLANQHSCVKIGVSAGSSSRFGKETLAAQHDPPTSIGLRSCFSADWQRNNLRHQTDFA